MVNLEFTMQHLSLSRKKQLFIKKSVLGERPLIILIVGQWGSTFSWGHSKIRNAKTIRFWWPTYLFNNRIFWPTYLYGVTYLLNGPSGNVIILDDFHHRDSNFLFPLIFNFIYFWSRQADFEVLFWGSPVDCKVAMIFVKVGRNKFVNKMKYRFVEKMKNCCSYFSRSCRIASFLLTGMRINSSEKHFRVYLWF